MNDEIADVQPTLAYPPSTKSSVSGDLDQVTTSSDQVSISSGQPCPLVALSVDDKIPLVRLPPETEFTSFSELSEFLKSAPMIFSAFTKLYGNP